MATRAIIARPTPGDGWEGRYHHWDGYPDELGRTLWHLPADPHLGGLGGVLRTLLDDHPAGWSSINGKDRALEPGFIEDFPKRSNRPECYCHGDRSEEPWLVRSTDANHGGAEWAYVIDEPSATFSILRLLGDPPVRLLGVFPMGGPEPDWEELTRRGYA